MKYSRMYTSGTSAFKQDQLRILQATVGCRHHHTTKLRQMNEKLAIQFPTEGVHRPPNNLQASYTSRRLQRVSRRSAHLRAVAQLAPHASGIPRHSTASRSAVLAFKSALEQTSTIILILLEFTNVDLNGSHRCFHTSAMLSCGSKHRQTPEH